MNNTHLGNFVTLLHTVDRHCGHETGALMFNDAAVLVEKGRTCWVASKHTREAFIPTLRRFVCNDTATTTSLAHVLQQCRQDHRSATTELITSGLFSEHRLRCALLVQAVDSMAALATRRTEPLRFYTHKRGTYRARFTFSTLQLLIEASAQHAALDTRSTREYIDSASADYAFVLAFQTADCGQPVPIAASGKHSLNVTTAVHLGRWATSKLGTSRGVVSGKPPNASGECELLAWRWADIVCVAASANVDSYACLADNVMGPCNNPTSPLAKRGQTGAGAQLYV